MINLGIIEDNESFSEGLGKYFNSVPGFACSCTAGSVEQFLTELPHKPELNVVLVDIGLPGISGIEGIKQLKERLPDADVIIMTVFDDASKIYKALSAGASGYLLKCMPFPEMKKAVTITVEGGSFMDPSVTRKVINYFCPRRAEGSDVTSREKQIVQCLVEGLSYKLTADRLCISLDTVRFHLRNLYKKLQVNSKAEVITKAYKGEI